MDDLIDVQYTFEITPQIAGNDTIQIVILDFETNIGKDTICFPIIVEKDNHKSNKLDTNTVVSETVKVEFTRINENWEYITEIHIMLKSKLKHFIDSKYHLLFFFAQNCKVEIAK